MPEPTLVVGAARAAQRSAHFAGLVARCGRVVAVDGGADMCRANEVVPDLVVGDFDSVDPRTVEWLESHGVEAVRFPADKDRSDLQLALDHVARAGVTSIVCTGVLGGRTDHTLAALGAACALAGAEVAICEEHESAWVCHGGQALELAGEGRTFSVIALSSEAEVTVEGAKWPLVHQVLSPLSSWGLSNVITGARARVSVYRGVVVVLVPWEEEAKPPVHTSRHSTRE